MATDMQAGATPKWMVWAGYVVTALPTLGLLASAGMKFAKPDGFEEGFTKLGWPEHLALGLGILELACVVLYLIPRTAVLGAILLTGYLGGAVATHVRIGDPYIAPVIMGVMVWGGIYLRDARIRALMPYRS